MVSEFNKYTLINKQILHICLIILNHVPTVQPDKKYYKVARWWNMIGCLQRFVKLAFTAIVQLLNYYFPKKNIWSIEVLQQNNDNYYGYSLLMLSSVLHYQCYWTIIGITVVAINDNCIRKWPRYQKTIRGENIISGPGFTQIWHLASPPKKRGQSYYLLP